MTKITTLKPKQAQTDYLTIDIVVKLPSGSHRISKLKYGKNELYLTPTTHKKHTPGIDFHTSYHGSGEIHSKLTRGKLRQATVKFGGGKTELLKIETLGEATPTVQNSEILLWRAKGTPLDQVKGAIQAYPEHSTGQTLTNIKEVAITYPVISKSKADYMFEIDAQSTQWIDTKYFLVEPGNVNSLKQRITDITNNWVRPHEVMTVEKAEVFTNLVPWLAIVLFKFSKKAGGSESFLSGQPIL